MNYIEKILCTLILINFHYLSGQYNLKKISEEMVFKNPPFQECHASTILEINENEILVAAFGGTKEGRKDVSIWLTRKTNSIWQTPIIVDTGKSNYNTEYPSWNPVLFKSMTGKITLFYKLGPSPREWWGEYILSNDQGENWSELVRLPDSILGPIKNKPVELSKGIILSPSSTETKTLEKYIWKSHIEKSTDNGENWTKIPIDHNSEFNVIQPTILVHSKGDNKSKSNKPSAA